MCTSIVSYALRNVEMWKDVQFGIEEKLVILASRALVSTEMLEVPVD